jgi:hypothetical protein
VNGGSDDSIRRSYLDLLQRSLLGTTVGPVTLYLPRERPTGRVGERVVRAVERRAGAVLARPVEFDMAHNDDGRVVVWGLPPWPKTMIGGARLANVEACVRDVVESGVPGDLIETGVWRGGAAIFMRGVLHAYGVDDRTVYVADSFEGLPPPDPERYPADKGLDLHLWPLAVSLDDVKANFERYGLLDEQVVFVKGWFRDSLPELRGHKWSVLRLDGDLYESTIDALQNLYPDLSPGGWVIVDDYFDIDACARAVDDYREAEGIREPMQRVDWTGMCWQKLG